MACGEPAMVSVAVPQVATPLALTATLLQSVVAPSLNVTLPSLLGLPAPAPLPVTAAVKVTDCPKAEGFTLELSAVDVARLLTVCPPDRVPVLLAKLAPLA